MYFTVDGARAVTRRAEGAPSGAGAPARPVSNVRRGDLWAYRHLRGSSEGKAPTGPRSGSAGAAAGKTHTVIMGPGLSMPAT